MSRKNLGAAIACFVLAILIFIFADGYRRLYSGIFFVVIGAVLLANAWRSRDQPDN
jgi:cell division protein FtsW (lipid II flippase)